MFTLLSGAFCAQAQDTKKTTPVTDDFKGTIEVSLDQSIATALRLTHEPYADDGKYLLNEVYINSKQGTKNAVVREGEWTVLKGSATDDNATVVELDDKQLKPIRYYLRLKNDDLQQLDTTLHEIKPAAKHILSKQAPERRTIVVKPTQHGQKQ